MQVSLAVPQAAPAGRARGAAPASANTEQLQRPRTELVLIPQAARAPSWQGHRPKVDVTTQEDRYARLVSSLRTFVLLADRLRRTAPQAAEMGQALVMGLHTVKKSTEGGNL